ncbi:MAG: hypothetical protein ABR978_00240 [Dehalococcoidia bacterium]|jgi:hypothetical protein
MRKSEAYKILHVTPPADARFVERAYWQLAHQYGEELNSEIHARQRLIELNEAYSALMSHERPATPELVEELPQPDFWSTAWEAFISWTRSFVASTAARWPERGAEVAVVTACLVALTALALVNGASLLFTLPTLAIALITIRAPWRRLH